LQAQKQIEDSEGYVESRDKQPELEME